MVEVLLRRAAQTPDMPANRFLIDGEEQGPWLGYGQLDQQARSRGRRLSGPTLAIGFLLLFAPGLAFISAFFGCQYAGVVPVPTYPPQPGRIGLCWEALGHIAQDCTPRVILVDRDVAPFIPTTGAIPALTGPLRG